ncbi:MAG: hypothetical protein GYB31_10975 [Bacteroidetes bacterium]|nr:hypothetical protein [Bacteroidota bacterium]
MYVLIVVIICSLVLAMLVWNVYFRVKVFKAYKELIKNRVEFGASHIFNKEKMEKEIMPKYPQHRDKIETFVGNLRNSIRMASVIIALITLFVAFLMFYPDAWK